MSKKRNNSSLEKALRDFISRASNAFTAEEAAEEIAATIKTDAGKIIPEIEEMLAEDNSCLDITGEEDLREKYIPRNRFFDKAEFCISPTQDEIDKGILIPGHRFMPFLNPDRAPSDSLLRPEDSEAVVGKREFKDFSDRKLEAYHSLIAGGKTKRSSAKKGNPEITVFDLKEIYRKHSFKLGDALLVSAEDSDKGVFRFSILPGSEKHQQLGDIQGWVLRMEEVLVHVLETFGQDIDVQSQLEQAYMADPSMMENVLTSFEEFLKISGRICLKPLENGTAVLWLKENKPSSGTKVKPEFSISTGSVESLDRILEELKAGLQSFEIEAFMRDELYNDRRSIDGVKKRCFAGFELAFTDEAQQIAFDNFLEELWEEVVVDYDRSSDEANGRLRGRALQLMEENIAFMRRLGKLSIMPHRIPKEEMLALTETTSVLGQLLNVLNNSGNQFEEDEMERMFGMLEEAVEALVMIKASMASKIPGMEDPDPE